MINRTTIDTIFQTAQVDEVIGEFVHLKKAGSNFKGLSPFSDEKTPSFMVSPAKQIWKDFSSGKGGNVVTFLMEHEHYTYPEALRYLAKKYNIEIEETEQTDEQKEEADARESMFLVTQFASNYFHDNLTKSTQGKAIGLSYFVERGFTEESIEKFRLGYAINESSAFTKAALDKGFKLDFLEKTGLTIVRDNRSFDRFKGRVIFPILSMSGRVLGFGGRILTSDKNVAKYLNSPESEIYHKSKVLYGIYNAKQAISKADNCYLVEGYTDVISLYQNGIENVVSSSGTALTPDQIRLISRLTKSITVLYDGDAAGIKASFRGIDLILAEGLNVKVLTFPDGDDPDSFARKNSNEELKYFLDTQAKDFISFKVSLLLEEAQNDPIKKANLIRDIVASISKIPDMIQREVYVQECARIMTISESVLFNELAQISKKKGTESLRRLKQDQNNAFKVVKQEAAAKIDTLYNLEREIIKILVLYGNEKTEFVDYINVTNTDDTQVIEKQIISNTVAQEIYLQLQEDEIEFTNPLFKSIYYEIINQLNQDESISLEAFITHESAKVSQTITDVLMDDEEYILSDWNRKNIFPKSKKDSLSKLVTDAILNLRRILIEHKIADLQKEVQEEPQIQILENVVNYTRLKQLLYDKLNRVV
ncbi:MAG: DNA primase [Flavobacteriaceae bacterium]|nr:DNA primase [Flavobacteriaceae bacterium]